MVEIKPSSLLPVCFPALFECGTVFFFSAPTRAIIESCQNMTVRSNSDDKMLQKSYGKNTVYDSY